MGNRRDRRAEKSRQRKESCRTFDRIIGQIELGKSRAKDLVPGSPCGHCGKVLDGASSSDGQQAKPGDITVCIYCAGANLFDDEHRLRRMTEDEVTAHDARDTIQSHQEVIRCFIAERPN